MTEPLGHSEDLTEEFHASGATGVRRLGNTVIRKTGPWTPSVHSLMAHARTNGVRETAKLLGFDEHGDEVLEFIPGDTAICVDGDDTMRKIGELARRLHDALATFTAPAGAVWRLRERGEAFAHGDVAPWNVIRRGGAIVGLIDWDMAGPGREYEDLAYAAWTWVPLDPDDAWGHDWGVEYRQPGARALRLRVLLDAFGADAELRRRFLSEVAHVQTRIAWLCAEGGMTGSLGLPGIWREGRHNGRMGRSMVWLDDNWDELAAALR